MRWKEGTSGACATTGTRTWTRAALGLGIAWLVLLPSIGPAAAQRCEHVEVTLGTGERRCLRPGAGEQFRDCAECPAMVLVPAGSLVMGSPPGEPERAAEREDQLHVTVPRPFAIGAFAVTRGEFAAFVAATGYAPEAGCWLWTGTTWEERSDRSWRAPGFAQDDRHPVTCVDLSAARAYAAWLSTATGMTYRLPSETEREHATRAGTSTPFWWGASISSDMANYDGTTPFAGGAHGAWRQATVPVDSFRPNPWGLYNVHGNVWDWTDDCWSEANAGNPGDGSARKSGDCTWRVVRGGAWNYSPTHLRSAFRYWNLPHNRSGVQGFRVVGAL